MRNFLNITNSWFLVTLYFVSYSDDRILFIYFFLLFSRVSRWFFLIYKVSWNTYLLTVNTWVLHLITWFQSDSHVIYAISNDSIDYHSNQLNPYDFQGAELRVSGNSQCFSEPVLFYVYGMSSGWWVSDDCAYSCSFLFRSCPDISFFFVK